MQRGGRPPASCCMPSACQARLMRPRPASKPPGCSALVPRTAGWQSARAEACGVDGLRRLTSYTSAGGPLPGQAIVCSNAGRPRDLRLSAAAESSAMSLLHDYRSPPRMHASCRLGWPGRPITGLTLSKAPRSSPSLLVLADCTATIGQLQLAAEPDPQTGQRACSWASHIATLGAPCVAAAWHPQSPHAAAVLAGREVCIIVNLKPLAAARQPVNAEEVPPLLMSRITAPPEVPASSGQQPCLAWANLGRQLVVSWGTYTELLTWQSDSSACVSTMHLSSPHPKSWQLLPCLMCSYQLGCSARIQGPP